MAKSQIIDQLVILAEAFGLSFNDARAEIYAECLKDLPIDKIRAGVVHLIRTRTFAGNLPTVAEIREAAGGGDDIDSRALLAWNEARNAIHAVGSYQSPKFRDPIISQIIVAWGGWEAWGDWPEKETRWKEKDFIQQYKIYAQAPERLPNQPDHLIGIAEGYNRDHFPEFVPEPVMIGNQVPGKKRLT